MSNRAISVPYRDPDQAKTRRTVHAPDGTPDFDVALITPNRVWDVDLASAK